VALLRAHQNLQLHELALGLGWDELSRLGKAVDGVRIDAGDDRTE
jgi:hypothetical protein